MIFDITKKDISTKEDVFLKIREIEDVFESFKDSYQGTADNVVSIIFDREVFEYTEQIRFVDPLFLILLFNSHSKYKKQALSINITFLSDNIQIYIHRFLVQFFDYLYIEPRGEKPTQRNSRTIISDEEIAIQAKERTDAGKRGILYYYSQEIYKNIESLSLNEDKQYKMLPIMSISNVINKDSFGATTPIQDERITIYYDIAHKNDKINLQKILMTFLGQLQEKDKESDFYINSLSMILFEIIDNIKRHTKDKNDNYANGYMSFHNDTSKKTQHELTITDDFKDGFLNRYLDVLKEELEQQKNDFELLGREFNEEINNLYLKDIKLLEDDDIAKSDIEVLEKLFDVDKTFGMHQLSRISMHFGVPSLMKLLKKLDGSLSIFLHRNGRYYKVIFYRGMTNVTELHEKENGEKYNGVDGTYYHIKFPKYEKIKSILEDDENTKTTELSLKSTNYTELFKNKVDTQKQISLFRYIKYEKLKKPRELENNKYIIISYNDYEDKNTKKDTISDFIRTVYRYAHLHDTKDILLVDFPIKENETYLFTLVNILYYQKKPNIINITILDNASFSSVFIGGKDKNEFKQINNLIARSYNQNRDSFFIEYEEDGYLQNDIPSELFFCTNKDKKKQYLLPFELFDVDGINIFSNMIENNLLKNKEDIHVDTQQGYHINQFYKFKLLFENSNWIKRFAFMLAKVIKEKEYKVIGTDKYSNVIISSAYSFIEESSDYYVLGSFNKNDLQVLEQYISNSDSFILYSPVIFTGKKVKYNIINKYFITENKNYNWQCGIKVSIKDDNLENFSSILNMKLKDENYENVFNSICAKCSGTQERALFKLDKNDSYSLEKFNLENYKSKSSRSYCEENEIIPRFFDSIYFGHTSRGKNHYTYYTKTIRFFENNIDKIKSFLDDIKIEEKKDNIIFAPIHSTNSRFLALVDKIVFNNDAEIHYFDTSKSEQNFYDLKNINIEVKKSNIYFIDDELSSGSTFRYFESLLISIDERLKFNSVIAMIDRASPQDERVFSKFEKNLHIFSKLEIKPIKTEFGNCFLCDRQEEYEKMFSYTVLDMNRFQIAKRVVKLNCNNYNDIDNNLNEDFATKLKTFIKMSAVDFAHKKFEKFEKIDTSSRIDIVNEYKKIETDFKVYIWILLNENLNNNILMAKQYFKDICDYESDIALLKSIAFPKIVYFKNIREIVTIIIIRRINDIISGACKKYIIKNHDKIEIKNIINEKDRKRLDREIKLKISYKNDKKEIIYLKSIRAKNGVNYLNFLYKTAGYLNINFILDIQNIEFYHRVTLAIKGHDNKFDYAHSLLHVYPFSVKMVTSYSDDKLDYFVNNLDEFFKNEKKKKKKKKENKISGRDYSMTHALFLGNNNSDINKNFKKELQNIKSVSIDKKIEELRILIDDIAGISIKNIFINKNINIKYDSYDNYLKGSELRDALNKFNELSAEHEENIMMLYKGALRVDGTDIDTMFEPLSNDIDKIDNTWSNMPFKINNEYFIAIRLVDIDTKALENLDNIDDVKTNDKIWFKPIGCIVLPYNNDYMTHLRYSRNILSLQKDIVEFFKQEFNKESIMGHIIDKQKFELKEKQSRIKAQNELELQKKVHEDLLKNVKLISHTYGDFINIDDSINEFRSNSRKDSDILDDVTIYTNTIKYIFYLGSLESTGKEDMGINAGFYLKKDFTFLEDTNSFLRILPNFSNKYKNNYKLESQVLSQFQCDILTDEHLYIILFEFILNGIKNNRNRDVNFKFLVDDAIYIANNGVELSKEDRDNLFIEGKSSSKSKGLGLGLSKIKVYLNNLDMNIEEYRGSKKELCNYNVIFKILNIGK